MRSLSHWAVLIGLVWFPVTPIARSQLPYDAFLSFPLEAFFAGKTENGQDKPLNLYLVRREGRWISGLGTATLKGKPIWNTALMPVDASALKLAGDRLSGPLTINLVPDPWKPDDRRPRIATITLDARLVPPATPEARPRLEGTWRSIIAEDIATLAAAFLRPEANGTFVTTLGIAPEQMLDDVSYDLALYDFLPTPGLDAQHGRLALSLGLRKAGLVSARLGKMDIRHRAYDYEALPLPAASDAFTATPDTFSLTIPLTIPDLEGNKRVFTLLLEGRRVVNWLVGEWRTNDGRSGWFRGNAAAGTFLPESSSSAADTRPWFIPVASHRPFAPGEHPRLFFRKSDLPELRRRAATPEGQIILARLRELLDGGDASLPWLDFNPATRAYENNKFRPRPGSYSISHAAGHGFLYQLSGDTRHAELARACVDAALAGQRNHDDRYAYVAPGGELRAGPTLGWLAVAYDLCYDAWPEDYRRHVARALFNYADQRGGEWNTPEGITFRRMVLTPKHGPASNHFGAVVGGCGLVTLALLDDPGLDQSLLRRYLAILQRNVIRHLSAGWGDGGYYAEGWGASRVGTQGAFLPFLQALRVAIGRDYVNVEHPNASYITMIPRTHLVLGPPAVFPYRSSMDPTYGRLEISQPDQHSGFSHGGYFSEGFGAVAERHKPALLWTHGRLFGDKPFDIASLYPHRAMLSLINWPTFTGLVAENPASSLPLAVRDHLYDHFAFRNRFQDADDILVTALLNPLNGTRPREVMVWGLGGLRLDLGEPPRATRVTSYRASADGSALLVTTENFALAVDYSRASGADAVVVVRGASVPKPFAASAAPRARLVEVGPYRVLTLSATGRHPEVTRDGDTLILGTQRLRLMP